MSAFLVSYDLTSPGRDYEELIGYLKGFGTYSHCLESTWVIVTDMTATELRDGISSHIDADDKVLVVQSAGIGAWQCLRVETTAWLRKHL